MWLKKDFAVPSILVRIKDATLGCVRAESEAAPAEEVALGEVDRSKAARMASTFWKHGLDAMVAAAACTPDGKTLHALRVAKQQVPAPLRCCLAVRVHVCVLSPVLPSCANVLGPHAGHSTRREQ